MKTTYYNHRRWSMLLLLFVCLPFNIFAQTKAFEMVVEKTDGTELAFRITDDYPILQYQYGGDEGVNTIEIQTASGYTSVPCPEIKRLITREVKVIPGDVTGTGSVDAQDASIVVNYIMGEKSSMYDYSIADMNGDNVVNIVDLILIINQIISKK